MASKEDTSIDYTNTLINKFSGLLGISGVSSDMRDLENAAADGNQRAQLALDMFAYRVKKYIGSYAAALGGVDIVVFTGGIGENDTQTRKKILSNLEYMGIKTDPEKDNIRGKETILSSKDSQVTVIVVPTDEEVMIARDTFEIIT